MKNAFILFISFIMLYFMSKLCLSQENLLLHIYSIIQKDCPRHNVTVEVNQSILKLQIYFAICLFKYIITIAI